jgi:metallo-beta-lactamase family protein
MSNRLVFLGAAGTVTGSKYLLEVEGARYLIDCGLFQGGSEWKERNWEPFPIEATSLDAVLLTHAHLDHSGYLPRLVQQGFRGTIYATEATCALLKILLLDAAHLQEQDADYANRKGYSRHRPALPLYTVEEAERTLQLLKPVAFHTMLELDGIRAFWFPMGHILGSGAIEIQLARSGKRILFSGDIGRYEDPIMRPPTEYPGGADIILMESTYGDRLHSTTPPEQTLLEAVEHIVSNRGVLLIPAFAVGRTQQVLYYLRRLQEQGQLPALPVFVDSPMAQDVTSLYCRFRDDLNLETSPGGDCEGVLPLYCYHTHFVQSVAQSKSLNTRTGPMIIVAGSGMCTGGRILHHLKWRLPDPANAVLFVGFQAAGTRGRMLLDGATEITIHGEPVPVRARIGETSALSAHADQHDLLRWVQAIREAPTAVYLVHGEDEARSILRDAIVRLRGWQVELPAYHQSIPL